MSKAKEIIIFLVVAYIVILIIGFAVGSITNMIFPPAQAVYGEEVVEDIGGDGILVATLDNCVKVGEESIPDDAFDTNLITNLSWSGAKNISYVDTSGNKGNMIVWKTTPDRYSVLNSSVSYISDYVNNDNGVCFMQYSPKTNSVYGIIIGSNNISYTESELMYTILDLDRSDYKATYSSSSYSSGYGGYGTSHYGGVDTSPGAIASTSPDWFYDYYDYGDYDDIDEFLESEGYD